MLRQIDNQQKSEINQQENFSEPFLMKILVQPNEPTVGFWCQMIVQKFLQRFNTSFEIKMMVKIYAIEFIFQSHKPFQSYQLTGPTNSTRKAG